MAVFDAGRRLRRREVKVIVVERDGFDMDEEGVGSVTVYTHYVDTPCGPVPVYMPLAYLVAGAWQGEIYVFSSVGYQCREGWELSCEAYLYYGEQRQEPEIYAAFLAPTEDWGYHICGLYEARGEPPILGLDDPDAPFGLRHLRPIPTRYSYSDTSPGEYEVRLRAPADKRAVAYGVRVDGLWLVYPAHRRLPRRVYEAMAVSIALWQWEKRMKKLFPPTPRRGHEDSSRGGAEGGGEDPNSHLSGHIPPPGDG